MLYNHNNSLGFIIYSAHRNLYRYLSDTLRPYGITPEQWNIINQLSDEEQVNQKQLADRSRKDQATITKLIDLLEKKELVERRRDATDRRAYLIYLTEKGQALRDEIIPLELAAVERISFGLDEEDLAVFNRIIKKINKNIGVEG